MNQTSIERDILIEYQKAATALLEDPSKLIFGLCHYFFEAVDVEKILMAAGYQRLETDCNENSYFVLNGEGERLFNQYDGYTFLQRFYPSYTNAVYLGPLGRLTPTRHQVLSNLLSYIDRELNEPK